MYLVDSTVEKGTRDVESLLRADWPVAAQIHPIDKHNTFFPTLQTQRGFNGLFLIQTYMQKDVHNMYMSYVLSDSLAAS